MHCGICVAVSMEIKCSILTYLPEYERAWGFVDTLILHQRKQGILQKGPFSPLIHFTRWARHGSSEIGPFPRSMFLSNPLLKTQGEAAASSAVSMVIILISSCHLNFYNAATSSIASNRIWIIFIYLDTRKGLGNVVILLGLDVCSNSLTAANRPSIIKSKCIFKKIKYYLSLYYLIGTMSTTLLLILLQKSEIW